MMDDDSLLQKFMMSVSFSLDSSARADKSSLSRIEAVVRARSDLVGSFSFLDGTLFTQMRSTECSIYVHNINHIWLWLGLGLGQDLDSRRDSWWWWYTTILLRDWPPEALYDPPCAFVAICQGALGTLITFIR